MRRFVVSAIPPMGDHVALSPEAAHHAVRVCRLAQGTEVMVFDGLGIQARAALQIDGEQVSARILAAPEPAAPSQPLHLILALLKGDAMSRALRMATEAGATHIHPAISERSVAKGDRRDRWERILESAAQQCGRADQPQLSDVQPLAAALLTVPLDSARLVAAPGGPRLDRIDHSGAAVAIGPEGGWSPQELRRFDDAGFSAVGLGEWVLRADTAVAVALGLLSP